MVRGGGSSGPDCGVAVGGRGKEPRDVTKDWKEEKKSVWLIAGSPCSGGGKALGTTRGLALAENAHCPAQKRREKPALVHVSAPRPPVPRLRGEQRTRRGGGVKEPLPARTHTRVHIHTHTKRTGDHGPRQLGSCLSEPRALLLKSRPSSDSKEKPLPPVCSLALPFAPVSSRFAPWP